MATRYVTDEVLRDAIGDAQVAPEALGQVLEDVQAVHALVSAEPWLTEASLRSKAEEAGLDPDRVNIALTVLASSGQVFAVSLTEKQIPNADGG